MLRERGLSSCSRDRVVADFTDERQFEENVERLIRVLRALRQGVSVGALAPLTGESSGAGEGPASALASAALELVEPASAASPGLAEPRASETLDDGDWDEPTNA